MEMGFEFEGSERRLKNVLKERWMGRR